MTPFSEAFRAIRPEPSRFVVSQCLLFSFFFLGSFFATESVLADGLGECYPGHPASSRPVTIPRVLCNFPPDTHQVWLRSSTLAMDDCNDAPWRLLMQLPLFVAHSRASLDSGDRWYHASHRGITGLPPSRRRSDVSTLKW